MLRRLEYTKIPSATAGITNNNSPPVAGVRPLGGATCGVAEAATEVLGLTEAADELVALALVVGVALALGLDEGLVDCVVLACWLLSDFCRSCA